MSQATDVRRAAYEQLDCRSHWAMLASASRFGVTDVVRDDTAEWADRAASEDWDQEEIERCVNCIVGEYPDGDELSEEE